MDPLREAVRAWLDSWLRRPTPPEGEGDVLGHHRWDGDDAFELIEAFAGRFGVDMTGYDWRFHHSDEGASSSPAWGPHWPADNSVPLSLDLLVEAARLKRWPVDYPAEGPLMRRSTRRAKRLRLVGLLAVGALFLAVLAWIAFLVG